MASKSCCSVASVTVEPCPEDAVLALLVLPDEELVELPVELVVELEEELDEVLVLELLPKIACSTPAICDSPPPWP